MAVAYKYTEKDIGSIWSLDYLTNVKMSVSVQTRVSIEARKAYHYIAFKASGAIREPDTAKVYIGGTQKWSKNIDSMPTAYVYNTGSQYLCYMYEQSCKSDGSFAPITIKAEIDFTLYEDKEVTFSVTAPSINLKNPTITNVVMKATESSVDYLKLDLSFTFGHQYKSTVTVKTQTDNGDVYFTAGESLTGTSKYKEINYFSAKTSVSYDKEYTFTVVCTVPETGLSTTYTGKWKVASDKTDVICEADVICEWNHQQRRFEWKCPCRFGHQTYPTKTKLVIYDNSGQTGFNTSITDGGIYDWRTSPSVHYEPVSRFTIGETYTWEFTVETTGSVYKSKTVTGTFVVGGNTDAPTISISSLAINRSTKQFTANVLVYHPYGLENGKATLTFGDEAGNKSYGTIDSDNSYKEYTFKGTFKAGSTYSFTLSAKAYITGKTAEKTVTAICPAKVDAITIDYVDAIVGEQFVLPYELINNDGASNFEITDVTFASSDTSVAEISADGIVTSKKAGYVSFTVTSADNIIGYHPSATKLFYIRAESGYPFSKDAPATTEYLTVPLIQNIINACTILDPDFEYITTVDDFNGYETRVRGIHDMMSTINSNVKALAIAKGIEVDPVVIAGVTKENGGAVWYTLVNEWLRLLSALAPSSGKYAVDNYGLYSESLDADAGGYYDNLEADNFGYFTEV